MTFAMVTILLIAAASLVPRSTRKWKAQMPTDETSTALIVLPSPKNGNTAPSVDLISTQYETLPTQALAQ